ERGDVLFAVLGAVVTAVAGKLSQERWRAGWRIIAKAAERAPDVAVFPARTLLRAGEGTGWLPEGAGRLLPVLELARPALR
ncbi:MAG: AAA family ATPase, partial [Dehalococcoidia bacterium]|nr:AAA family ATPase [Dehalococcoidia bacterium]